MKFLYCYSDRVNYKRLEAGFMRIMSLWKGDKENHNEDNNKKLGTNFTEALYQQNFTDGRQHKLT